MKKMLSFSLVFLLTGLIAVAQEAPKEPKNVGISEFDTFKNNSFDILDDSNKLKESATTIDSEIKNYSGVMNTLSLEKLKANFKAVKDGVKSTGDLSTQVAELSGQSKAVLEKAKKVKPAYKSPGAVKNTNSSIKALDFAKKDLAATKEIFEANLQILKEEMKSRGELIE